MKIGEAVSKAYKNVKDAFNLKMWSDDAFLQQAYYLNSAQYRNGGYDYPTDGFMESPTTSTYSYKNVWDAIDAYRRCPPITAVINKKAQAFTNGKTWVLNLKDNKEATSADAKTLSKRLAKPNPLQSWKQFEAQGYIYQQLFGYNVVFVVKPAGYKNNIDASSLWNLPPYMLSIFENNKVFYQEDLKGMIDRVSLTYKGGALDLNIDDLFFFKDFSPSLNTFIIPESRIISLELPIKNIIGAYESRNVLINNRGAQGIFSSDQGDASGKVALTTLEKDNVHKDFKRYGLRNGQWQHIITSAAIKWQSTGYPTRDLMLFEEIEGSTMAICDGFGYPYRLMAAEKSASYNDVNEFGKKLYQDNIIPESHAIYEQWNELFGLRERGLKLDKDFSHLPILQADAVMMAQARNQRNQALEREYRYDLITRNRWLQLNDEDPVKGGDIYFSEWLKAGGLDPYARNSGAAATLQDGVNPSPTNTPPTNG